jgi:catechol 2,3-dioxygenase
LSPQQQILRCAQDDIMNHGIRAPNYRLPDATTLGRVKLQVSDLERSLSFYTAVLGLRALKQTPGHAILGATEGDSPIVELVEREGVRSVPPRGRLGLFHFAILLPDRAALGKLVRHLGDLDVHPGMSDHFVSEAIYLQDPDNLGIEVYADRPRSEWRVENGQLAMATEPLDVENLLAESGDARWTGAPAGTRIGHVHLHVGDLEKAEAFYHNALGLDKVVWNYPGALFLSAGGYHHHLGTNTWARGAPSASDDDARLLEWEIIVPQRTDVDAAASSLERARYAVQRDGADALANDPWGTQLRLKGEVH